MTRRRAELVAAALLILLTACGRDDTAAPGAAAPTAPATGPSLVAPPPQQGQPPQAAPPQGQGAPASASTAAAGDSEQGRQVYVAQCVACHNRDPSKDGPVGPAVKGSPRDLVEARVVRAQYPAGYKPKRESKVMPARPDLAASVPDLAVYLR